MAISRAGVAKLQSFGVVFGYPRVVIYVEPSSGDNSVVVSNTARTSLILNDVELTQTVSASMRVRDRVKLSTVSVVVLLKQGLVRNSHHSAFVIVA